MDGFNSSAITTTNSLSGGSSFVKATENAINNEI